MLISALAIPPDDKVHDCLVARYLNWPFSGNFFNKKTDLLCAREPWALPDAHPDAHSCPRGPSATETGAKERIPLGGWFHLHGNHLFASSCVTWVTEEQEACMLIFPVIGNHPSVHSGSSKAVTSPS